MKWRNRISKNLVTVHYLLHNKIIIRPLLFSEAEEFFGGIFLVEFFFHPKIPLCCSHRVKYLRGNLFGGIFFLFLFFLQKSEIFSVKSGNFWRKFINFSFKFKYEQQYWLQFLYIHCRFSNCRWVQSNLNTDNAPGHSNTSSSSIDLD